MSCHSESSTRRWPRVSGVSVTSTWAGARCNGWYTQSKRWLPSVRAMFSMRVSMSAERLPEGWVVGERSAGWRCSTSALAPKPSSATAAGLQSMKPVSS